MAERIRPDLPPFVLGDTKAKDSSSSSTRPGQFLTVDETKRPRANSDPVGLRFDISSILPEITVTADDADDTGSNDDDEVDNFLGPPAPRPRANTCPEDMFQQRKERPPTPPPSDIGKSPVSRRKRFNFPHNTKDVNGISFIHHKLCKVNEDGGAFPNILNGHRRHSTGRRASCLAALSESSCLLEEENEIDVVPIALSHSMNALSMSSSSSSGKVHQEHDNKTLDEGETSNDNFPSVGGENTPILLKCSVGVVENNNGSDRSRHVITSDSAIR